MSPDSRCPCGSHRKYKRCCLPVHEGRPAPTAEALMRSRYSAYALGLAEHVLATTHPEGPHHEEDRAAWLAEVRRFCEDVAFDRLEVRGSKEDGDRALVDFVAHLRQGDRRTTLAERSLFLREDGRWLYHSGKRLDIM